MPSKNTPITDLVHIYILKIRKSKLLRWPQRPQREHKGYRTLYILAAYINVSDGGQNPQKEAFQMLSVFSCTDKECFNLLKPLDENILFKDRHL